MQQAVQNTPSPLERNLTVSVPIAQIGRIQGMHARPRTGATTVPRS